MTAHWGIPDPAAVEGPEQAKVDAFRKAFRVMERRIGIFINLPIATLDNISLSKALRTIGDA